MGALSRRKGAQWERDVARMLTEALGRPCLRELEEVRSGNCGDIRMPADVPLSIQCKIGAVPPIYGAIQEARESAKPGQIPIAIIRRNKAGARAPEELAVLPLKEMLGLLRKVYGGVVS